MCVCVLVGFFFFFFGGGGCCCCFVAGLGGMFLFVFVVVVCFVCLLLLLFGGCLCVLLFCFEVVVVVVVVVVCLFGGRAQHCSYQRRPPRTRPVKNKLVSCCISTQPSQHCSFLPVSHKAETPSQSKEKITEKQNKKGWAPYPL